MPRWKTMFAICCLFAAGCAQKHLPPLEPVGSVDIERYTGKWYEVARMPFKIQEGCHGTTATYTLRDDGNVEVVNRCYDGSLDGPERTAKGKAWAVSGANSRLKVSFFWPFRGDYWILDLDPDYQYAMVGEPGRRYLWILSRTPRLDESTYLKLVEKALNAGYDTAKLQKTVQP